MRLEVTVALIQNQPGRSTQNLWVTAVFLLQAIRTFNSIMEGLTPDQRKPVQNHHSMADVMYVNARYLTFTCLSAVVTTPVYLPADPSVCQVSDGSSSPDGGRSAASSSSSSLIPQRSPPLML